MRKFIEKVKQIFARLVYKFRNNPNSRRWLAEACLCISIGIIVGCVTFNALTKDKKSLNVSDESATAPKEKSAPAEGEGLPPDDPDSDVVIEIIDDAAPTAIPKEAYAPPVNEWSQEEIDAAIQERGENRSKNKFQGPVTSFWESRSVTDVEGCCMYLYHTDQQAYTPADFEGVPAEVIHIAKNEIYARHGYSFKDAQLYGYFMGQVWYTPSVMPADFSEEIFSETEVKNLDLLNSIDTM